MTAFYKDIFTASTRYDVGFALGELFGRYIPFRGYHYLDSTHHILKNEIRTSIDGTFNEVEIFFTEDEGNLIDDDTDDTIDQVEAVSTGQAGILAVKLDENIPEASIRSYKGEYPSCVTDGMAKRYAQGIFARTLRDAYKGELCIIGDENIKPYDVCVAPNTKIDTIDGFKNIEDIKLGDLVLTHKGRFKPVTQLFKRTPKETVYDISCRTCVSDADLTITGNHPVLALRQEKVLYGGQIQRKKMWNSIVPEFISVNNLKPGDYLVIPSICQEKTLPEEFAKLLGYYLAEGSIVWENRKSNKIGRKGNNTKEYSDKPANVKVPVAVKWSFDLSKELYIYNEINNLLKYNGCKNAKMYKNINKNELVIVYYDRKFTSEIIKHAGFSDNKENKTNKWLRYQYDFKTSVNIVGKYLSGDGSQDKNRGFLTGCSVSFNLINSIYRLLINIGIPVAVSKNKINSKFSASDYAYVVRLQKKFSNMFSDFAERFKDIKNSSSSNSSKFIKDNYCYVPIDTIKQNTTYSDFVYNIGVEEDNSYVANNKIVHNCYLNDMSINMTGPIEVEEVVHVFNRDYGFMTIITPDLCVEVNDYYTASVFDITASAMSLSWGMEAAITTASFLAPPVGAAIQALRGVSFLALSAGVKFMQWSQEGNPVIATPLTLGGKPMLSNSLGPNHTSMFLSWGGKWNQYWDDLGDAWDRFDIAEAVFEGRVNFQKGYYELFGADATGGARDLL
jgi:intein/homing endonuclease